MSAPPPGAIVGAVRVEGGERFGAAAFASQIESVLGKAADEGTLQQLANAIARQVRDEGYIFASVIVPPQAVRMGIVTVRLDPGLIDEVRIIGSTNRLLSRTLQPLARHAVRKQELERQILLAEDIPGIRVVRTRYLREGDRRILEVQVSEDRVEASLALDNWGSSNYGPVRARLSGSVSSLAVPGDQIDASGTLTVAEPDELAYGSLGYSMPVSSGGARIGAIIAGGHTRPGEQPDNFNLSGNSRSAIVSAITPIQRSVDQSLWLGTEIAYLKVDQQALGLMIQRDVSTSITLTFNGSTKIAGGRLDWGVRGTRGVDLFGASSAGDPLLSRADGSAIFTKGVGWFNWFGTLTERVALRVAAAGQLASRPLLSEYELGFGGAYFGRAYNFFEVSGDDGIIGLVELRHSLPLPWKGLKWAHVYGFVDGGHLHNHAGGYGGGTLFSSGAGVRASTGPFELGVEGAIPLKRAPYGDGGLSPRYNFVLGVEL